jgi:2-C-methyl-D-erythritol 4-phosphate cytidylyltransferase
VYCRDLAKNLGFKKVTTIIEGASTRQGSVFAGIKQLRDDVTHVLIHDAARPNISKELIEKCCDASKEYGACAVGVRVCDTLKFSEDGEFIGSTVDRSKLWQIQTPQAFDKKVILKCHKNAAFESFEATDDCMLLEKYGYKIKLIEGSYDNIKITGPRDLAVMEGILKCE